MDGCAVFLVRPFYGSVVWRWRKINTAPVVCFSHDIGLPRAFRLESHKIRCIFSGQSHQFHMERAGVGATAINSLGIHDTAHLVYRHLVYIFYTIAQFGSNLDYSLSLVCHIRIVSRVTGCRYHLLGTRVHGKIHIICIIFRGILLHTIFICFNRAIRDALTEMLAYIKIRVFTLPSFGRRVVI